MLLIINAFVFSKPFFTVRLFGVIRLNQCKEATTGSEFRRKNRPRSEEIRWRLSGSQVASMALHPGQTAIKHGRYGA